VGWTYHHTCSNSLILFILDHTCQVDPPLYSIALPGLSICDHFGFALQVLLGRLIVRPSSSVEVAAPLQYKAGRLSRSSILAPTLQANPPIYTKSADRPTDCGDRPSTYFSSTYHGNVYYITRSATAINLNHPDNQHQTGVE
jgi:hypothetical protein